MWLIDRDALLGDALAWFTILERDKNYQVFATAEVKQILADVVEAQPTVDAVPVVHGWWKEWWPGDCSLIMTGEEMLFECSVCTAKFANQSNYCPNCGAKMDGGEGDG